MDVRERIDCLLDKNSFNELDEFVEHDCIYFEMEKRRIKGDGLVTGFGKINGRLVSVYAHDSSFLAGSSSKMHAAKICKIIDISLKCGIPIIAINDSSGARIHEGIDVTATYPEVFYKTVKASGVVPQISVVLGKCAGAAAYNPALTDLIIMCHENSNIFLTGPAVIKAATGEEVTVEDIGSSAIHCGQTGLSHFVSDTEEDAIRLTREMLSYLPQNNCESSPVIHTGDVNHRLVDIADIIPSNPNDPYDVRKVITAIVDEGDYLEIHKDYAPNIVVCLSRLAGQTVGIVANQSAYLSGCIDIKASEKAARFVRFCNTFNIPIINLVDVPGFLPGLQQETGGIIKYGAQLLFAYCELSVPKVSVILRKAYGGAYAIFANRFTGADICYALPETEISVMGPEGAVDVIFRKDLKNSCNFQEDREKFIKEYREQFASPYASARKGYIDGIINPEDLRNKIISALQLLSTKIGTDPLKKHSNMPV